MTTFYMLLCSAAFVVGLALVFPLLRNAAWPLRRRMAMSGIILLFVMGGGLVLYSVLGAPGIVKPAETQRTTQATLRQRLNDLLAQTNAQPADAKGWAALGEAWMEARQYGEAVPAFRQAVLTSGGQPDLIAAYAAALVMQSEGVVNEEAARSIAMALQLNPAQALALKLHALQEEQKKGATPPHP